LLIKIDMTQKKKPTNKTHRKKKQNKILHGVKPLISDENILFKRIKRGDDTARYELLDKYSAWATNIAKKYHSLFPNIEVSELEAEGNRGLIEAVDRFDPSKKVKFSTYSWFWIIKNIQEYITSSINLIGVPAKVMSDLKLIVNTINDGIKNGNDPSMKEISQKLGIREVNVNQMLSDKKNVSSPLSLDMYLNSDEKEEKLADMVEDKKLDSIKKILDGIDDNKMISALLGQLLPVEQKVLNLRFGFQNNKPCPLRKIADQLKLSPSKVKDIESIAIMKLKRFGKHVLHKEHEKEATE